MMKARRSDASATVPATPAAAGGPVVLQLKGMLAGKDFATQERMLAPIQMRPRKTPHAPSTDATPVTTGDRGARDSATPGPAAPVPTANSGAAKAPPAPTPAHPSGATDTSNGGSGSTPDQASSATQGGPDQNDAAPQDAADGGARTSPLLQSIERALATDGALLAQWNDFLEEDRAVMRDLEAGLRAALVTDNEALAQALDSAIGDQGVKYLDDMRMIDALEDVISNLERFRQAVEANPTGIENTTRDPQALHEDLLMVYRANVDSMSEQRDELRAQIESQELVQSALGDDGMIDDDEQAAINSLQQQCDRLGYDISNARRLIRSLERVLANATWDDDAS